MWSITPFGRPALAAFLKAGVGSDTVEARSRAERPYVTGWKRSRAAKLSLRRHLGCFAIFGAIATEIQYLVLLFLVEAVGLDPVVSSSVGYITSAALNYGLNHRFTFGGTASHVQALPRFLLVSSSGLLVNAAVIGLAHDILRLHYLLAQMAATGAVFLWNFLGSRFWSFRTMT